MRACVCVSVYDTLRCLHGHVPKSTRSWNSLGQIDALYITVSWTWSGSWTPECVQSPKRWFLETWSALVTAVTVPVTFLCIMMYQQAISIDFPFRPPLLLVAPAGRRKARIRYRNTTPTNWSTHFVQHPSSATNACSGFILFLPEIWVLEYIYIIYNFIIFCIYIYILKFLLVRALLEKKEIHPTWDEKNETRIFCTGRWGFGVGSSISSRASSEPWNQAGGSEMENSDRLVTGQININQHNTRDKPK